MPKMYSLELFIFSLLFGIVLIIIIDLKNNIIAKKIKGMYRIGPHNRDILSIIYGSLLGDAHAEKRLSGLGTRISFYQEDTHLKYIFYLHSVLSKSGYCNNKLPIITQRLGVRGIVRKVLRFNT
jgi:ubiquinol-cytochrome c reductase cytochrome b subunit